MPQLSVLWCLLLFFGLFSFAITQLVETKQQMVPVPQIEQSYDVVHSDIYRGASKFAPALPPNFYVEKAIKEKAKLVMPDIQSSKPSQLPARESTKIDTNQAVLITDDNAKKQLDSNALASNNDNLIQWKIESPLFPPLFVVENGVQVKLREAPLKGTTTVEHVEEGIFPNEQNNNFKGIPAMTQLTSESANHQPLVTPLPGSPSNTQTPTLNPPNKKGTSQKNFSSQVEKQRYIEHRKTLFIISCLLFVLLAVFLLVRSQREKKKQSMTQLHSRFQQFREEEQMQIIRGGEGEARGSGLAQRGRGLGQDEQSDEDEMQRQPNTLIE